MKFIIRFIMKSICLIPVGLIAIGMWAFSHKSYIESFRDIWEDIWEIIWEQK